MDVSSSSTPTCSEHSQEWQKWQCCFKIDLANASILVASWLQKLHYILSVTSIRIQNLWFFYQITDYLSPCSLTSILISLLSIQVMKFHPQNFQIHIDSPSTISKCHHHTLHTLFLYYFCLLMYSLFCYKKWFIFVWRFQITMNLTSAFSAYFSSYPTCMLAKPLFTVYTGLLPLGCTFVCNPHYQVKQTIKTYNYSLYITPHIMRL